MIVGLDVGDNHVGVIFAVAVVVFLSLALSCKMMSSVEKNNVNQKSLSLNGVIVIESASYYDIVHETRKNARPTTQSSFGPIFDWNLGRAKFQTS
jgi:hypothetical protein